METYIVKAMKFGIYTIGVESWMAKKDYPKIFKGMFGWGNGYVLLPHNHPFYGKDYGTLNINIHGGLTFGDYFSDTKFLEWIEDKEIFGDITRDNFELFNNYWMIGFDTSHYGDNKESCSKEFVMNEVNNLLEQCLDENIEGIKIYKDFYFI